MRELFRQHPPNIVVVSGMEGYGFYLQTPLFWLFILISAEYINLWKDADRSSELGLELTALITATIDHEIGHWIFTLKAGYFSSERPNKDDSEGLLENDKDSDKRISKKLGAEWKANSGEAGNFVETRSRGGIIEYSSRFQRGQCTEDEAYYFLPKECRYLCSSIKLDFWED